MIKDWNVIKEQFDAIKDHKPRAVKKLNDLGDILASAYMLDPNTANDMWQYIVDLNIADDITFSKFYIAQVFNKLTDRMKAADATAFLSMVPERVQLMILYGYDGGTLWHCLEVLINGYLEANDVENALICLGYFYDKFGGFDSGNEDIINVAKRAAGICANAIKTGKHTESAERFLIEIGNTDNEEVNGFVTIVKAINGIGTGYNYDMLFNLARSYKMPNEFFELLWAAKNEYSLDELREKWINYIETLEEGEVGPWAYLHDEAEEYEGSKLELYVLLERESEVLLNYYFNRYEIHDVEIGVVWSWVEDEDWDSFTRYLSLNLMNVTGGAYGWNALKRMLDDYMRACEPREYSYTSDDYGRKYEDLMKGKVSAFCDALSKISAITVGCEAHDDYHEIIKVFLQKTKGNLDSLNELGFDDEVEIRSAEDRLKEYVHEFLSSGEFVHDERDTKYSLICKALNEELNDARYSKHSNHTITFDVSKMILKSLGQEVEEDEDDDEEEEIDYSLEQDYRFACDEELAEFFFRHCPREYHRRTSLLGACIKKNDISRAIELIDMMIENKDASDYEALNGWGRQDMLAIMYLIHDFEYDSEDSWRSEGVTNEMRQNVKQLVYRILPHLPVNSQEELKKDLYKIDPESDDSDEYINQLLEDASAYAAFPKPKGKGSAQNVNRMSDEFIHCFERLSKLNRLDVVAEIMSIFAEAKDTLKPVTYASWMSFMARGLRTGDMAKVFRLDRSIFEAWLEIDDLREWDIKRVAEGIADGCTRAEFQDFRNLVVSHKGKIEGLDTCFEATSENTETQLLFDGQTLKLSLDYLEVNGDDPILEMEFHFISISKCRDLSSVRLLKCEINGIETKDCSFWSEMDEEPTIGYYIYDDNEECKDELTVYSDFFEDNNISEVNRIVLRFVVMNDDAESIEEMTDIILELDEVSGEYKVKQQAVSIKCTADFSLDSDDDVEDEDEEDGSKISVDLSDIFRKALVNALSGTESDDESEDGEEDDEDEFEDIVIYEEDDDVSVEFCGVEFDADSEELTLSIWCSNHSDDDREFWIDELMINGEKHGAIQIIGTVESHNSEFCDYTIEDVDYFDVETIGFIIEVDDDVSTALGTSKNVFIQLNADDEKFKVEVSGEVSILNEEAEDFDDDIDDDIFEEVEFDNYLDTLNISSDQGLGKKISAPIGTLKELISMMDYELPFKVQLLTDSEKHYEIQTIRDGYVYAEVFEGSLSVDYYRFNINDSQKFIIMEG